MSLLARVPMARHEPRSIVFEKKRTEPSAMEALTPFMCRLRAAAWAPAALGVHHAFEPSVRQGSL